MLHRSGISGPSPATGSPGDGAVGLRAFFPIAAPLVTTIISQLGVQGNRISFRYSSCFSFNSRLFDAHGGLRHRGSSEDVTPGHFESQIAEPGRGPGDLTRDSAIADPVDHPLTVTARRRFFHAHRPASNPTAASSRTIEL